MTNPQRKDIEFVAVAPERRRRLAIVISRSAGFVGVAIGLLAGWVALPTLLYGRQEQPLSFNHKIHTEDGGMSCEDCHAFRDDGTFPGIPSTAMCADCHAEVSGESAAEKTLVEDYVTPGREIPWLVYSRQPDNVFFPHAAHVRLAEIECRYCHGDRGASEASPPYEYNRISTYSRNIWGPRIAGGGPNTWDSMKMSHCTRCHAERGVKDSCLMCHK